jgi:uncharacterized membrane protein YeaQ/YmgE (transglycosylase-associated protein family)
MKKKWKWKLNLGHLHSQKFAGLIFGIVACFLAGFFMESEPTTSAVVMGIVGLYTAFVGGRAWSDNATMKYRGGPIGLGDREEVSVVRRMKRTVEVEEKEKKEREDEID